MSEFSENAMIIILVILVLVMCVNAIRESDYMNLVCVISNVDGNEYCVRDRKLTQKAVDLLGITVKKCNKLVKHLEKIEPDNKITKRLVENYNPRKVKETLPTSKHTAYSENKGEKLSDAEINRLAKRYRREEPDQFLSMYDNLRDKPKD